MAGVLTVVARIHPKAGRENEVEGLLVKMAAAVRQHEPDCIVYRPHRSTGEPTVFYFYEQYRTDAAFEFHRTAAHLAEYRARRRRGHAALRDRALPLADVLTVRRARPPARGPATPRSPTT